jgi:hypothetical protein
MHYWGDKDFDWDGLDKAIRMIHKDLIFWRIAVTQAKEKYGTCRIYCSLGWNTLHSITHPGHCFSRYPKWLWRLDIYVLSKIIRKLKFIVVPIHKWAYRRAYKKACDRFPHLVEEICCMADYIELLDFYRPLAKEQ